MAERAIAAFADFDSYKLTGVKRADGDPIRGAYATVTKVEYMGLRCAGKKINDWLITNNERLVNRFEEECRILSQLRHPNIVQFLGVYFQEGERVPMLILEFLPLTLTSYIQQYTKDLKQEITYSILNDVALGLHYLHSQAPPIIHRDLYSNNILLTTNMTAKISDLGMAKILKETNAQLTRSPGHSDFMPPEVMIAHPKYDISIDEFSYGIMMIHVLSGMWPEPQIEPVRIEGDSLIPVTEAERREMFLQEIGTDHLLMDLILKCISNNPSKRAHTNEIVERMTDMVSKCPSSFANKAAMLKHIGIQEKDAKRLDREVRDVDHQAQISIEDDSPCQRKIARQGDFEESILRKATHDLPMKDAQGVFRGKCTRSGCDCEGYRTVSLNVQSGFRCDYCDHTPTKHIMIIELGECQQCGKCDKYKSEDPCSYTNCTSCTCPADFHAGAEKVQRPFTRQPPQVSATVSLTSEPRDLSSDNKHPQHQPQRILIRPATSQELSEVTQHFTRQWKQMKGRCPDIDYVYVITNTKLSQRWTEYQQALKDKTVEQHYHGTKLTCDIITTQTLCDDQNCGICGIASEGLNVGCIGKNIDFHRFGDGFYLAPNSSKCHEYTRGFGGYRAMLLCDVCPGTKYKLKTNDQFLEGPPQGYNSIYGEHRGSLNYDELVVHNPDAVMPRYVIVYQKDGIEKIAL